MNVAIKNCFKGLIFIAWLVSFSANAQLHVEISGVGATQIPIAIAGFTNEEMSPQMVSTIIKNDLDRSGYFKILSILGSISETDTGLPGVWRTCPIKCNCLMP